MSLYRHVPSRDALLDGVAERLAAEIEAPDHGRDWADALRALAGELRAIARRHPAAFELVGLRVLATAGALAPLERRPREPARAAASRPRARSPPSAS